MSRRGQRPAGDRTNRCSGAVKWALALTLTLTPAAIVLACEIPVYQWALLNWEPDVYELLVFHDEPLPPDTVQALQALTAKAPSAQQALNIRVRVVGPGPDAEADAAHIRQREETGTSPWVALRHPGMPPDFPSLWTAGATVETLRQLSHSAARDKITDALLRGTSHVWVVLECGEQEKDAGAWSRLETALAEMAAAINPDTISPNAHITHEIVSVRRTIPRRQSSSRPCCEASRTSWRTMSRWCFLYLAGAAPCMRWSAPGSRPKTSGMRACTWPGGVRAS